MDVVSELADYIRIEKRNRVKKTNALGELHEIKAQMKAEDRALGVKESLVSTLPPR